MPNQPSTPHRTIRVSGEIWEAAQAKALEKGETVSEVVRKALVRYAARK